MSKFNDTVTSWGQEDGSTLMPDDGLSLLSAAYDEDIAGATTTAEAAAKADIQSIIDAAVTAAVATIKAEAFEALLETAGTGDADGDDDTDDTDSGSNGSENDDEDTSVDDLFRS